MKVALEDLAAWFYIQFPGVIAEHLSARAREIKGEYSPRDKNSRGRTSLHHICAARSIAHAARSTNSSEKSSRGVRSSTNSHCLRAK